MEMKGRSLVAIDELSKGEIESVLNVAGKMLDSKNTDLCKGKIMAALFFEPSTRTRLSFETAMHRLGGDVIGFSDAGTSSAKKGESIADTIRTVEQYADIIVMRHFIEGAARTAAEYSKIPIINAGDGSHEHPTQTLLDLYTIKKEIGKLEGVNIALVGDLKYGRTTHSLAKGIALFDGKITCVSPEQLHFPSSLQKKIEKETGQTIKVSKDIEDAFDSDIIYMTRIQKERFGEVAEYEKVRYSYVLTPEMCKKTKALIMHPLPRVDEIEYGVDEMDKAVYFKQAGYGIPVRMALIAMMLGVANE